MTIEYKANNFTVVELHQVLEYCYTGSVPFNSLSIPETLVNIKQQT